MAVFLSRTAFAAFSSAAFLALSAAAARIFLRSEMAAATLLESVVYVSNLTA